MNRAADPTLLGLIHCDVCSEGHSFHQNLQCKKLRVLGGLKDLLLFSMGGERSKDIRVEAQRESMKNPPQIENYSLQNQ